MVDRMRSLRAEVEASVPADEREHLHRMRLLELLGSGEDCFTRHCFRPGHVTASAFIVDPSAGSRLLLHRHRRLGRWLQMGGHVDQGERAIDAALREGVEESGLGDLRLVSGAILDLDVHEIPAARDEPDHLHFDVRYLFATAEPDEIAMQKAESEDLRWFALRDAIAVMNEEASTRAIRKIARMLGESGW